MMHTIHWLFLFPFSVCVKKDEIQQNIAHSSLDEWRRTNHKLRFAKITISQLRLPRFVSYDLQVTITQDTNHRRCLNKVERDWLCE